MKYKHGIDTIEKNVNKKSTQLTLEIFSKRYMVKPIMDINKHT